MTYAEFRAVVEKLRAAQKNAALVGDDGGVARHYEAVIDHALALLNEPDVRDSHSVEEIPDKRGRK